MEINPVLRRELRVRWRHWHGFAMILGYGASLAGDMVYQYHPLSQLTLQHRNARELELTGHQLFTYLTHWELAGAMMLGVMLMATGLAAERESGMLEAMQLTPLSPLKIVAGKLGSAWSFVVLMLLVPLPVNAICFQLGGVAPRELVVAEIVQAAAVVACLCGGLACSAWCRRPLTGLTASLAMLGFWGGCAYLLNDSGYPLGTGCATPCWCLPRLWPTIHKAWQLSLWCRAFYWLAC